MSLSTTIPTQTTLVFDSLAARYDNLFTKSLIGRAQRNAVWDVVTRTFQHGNHILELNCGTGEDALFLSKNGISVVACDASEQMIQVAKQRLRAEASDAPIEFHILPTEHLSELSPTKPFDGAFSNFSGLNCVENLSQTARDLAAMVAPGCPILLCFSTRFCISEMLWFLFHGQVRKAFRRCSGHTTAKVGEFTANVHYPTIRDLQKLFAPSFVIRSYRGIGVTVPPSYVEAFISRYPKALDLLRSIDESICDLPGFRAIGDHVLIRFERVQA